MAIQQRKYCVPAEIPVSSARKKMWWQDQSDPVKPYVIDLRRDPCGCSQNFKLRQTGYAENQGPTHFCPGCRWAFWPVKISPTASQITEIKKTIPEATNESLSYIKMCNKPPLKWGTSHKNIMIDQLGGKSMVFLTSDIRAYWVNLYCEKYPTTVIAKYRRKLQEKRDNMQSY